MCPNPDCYSIKWNDYYSYLGGFFASLYISEQFTDVTLCAEKVFFKCHKVVLSAASLYFQEILSISEGKHPFIILAGVKAEDIKVIIEFIYNGEMKNIDYERFISVLQTAQLLKINGLTDVTICHSTAETVDVKCNGSIENMIPENCKVPSSIEGSINTAKDGNENDSSVPSEKAKSERTHKYRNAKKYWAENLERALKDMEWGMPLTEAARLYKIPRSTLYSKAKHHSGLQIVSRKEHSYQDCRPALQAISDGMSLKRAAEEFNIPKTVLWRRVQKSLDILNKVKCRKKRAGKQQTNCVQNSKEEDENDPCCSSNKSIEADVEVICSSETESKKSLKKERLSQAVVACKMGKMSQAAASATFQVPKTTIWRQLQKCSGQEGMKPRIVIKNEDHELSVPENCQLSVENYNQIEMSSEHLPEDMFSQSVIILDSNNSTDITVSDTHINVEVHTEEIT